MQRKVRSSASLNSFTQRVLISSDDTRHLLPHLSQFTPEHQAEGFALQAELSDFEQELIEAVEEIWRKPVAESVTPEDNLDKGKQRLGDPLEKVPKPDPKGDEEWRMKMFKQQIEM